MELNTNNVKIKAGVNLVARTELRDPRFMMSVVLICHHGEDGSLGLALNRPTTLFFNPSEKRLHDGKKGDGDFMVFLGGPVQPGALFFLYRDCARDLPDSKEVMPGLYMSSNPENLALLSRIRPIDDANTRFFIGYAGWSYFQLDCEASSGVWFAHPASMGHVFHDSGSKLWLELMREMGEDFFKAGVDFLHSLG